MDWPRSELIRVAWQLGEEGRLERRFWTVLDRTTDSESRQQEVLSEVRRFEVQLLDSDGGVWSSWPPETLPETTSPEDLEAEPAGQGEEAPELIALRLQLELPPFGRVERLLPLPQPMPALARNLPGDGTTAEGDETNPDTAPTDGETGAQDGT